MKAYTLFKHELKTILSTPTMYIVSAAFIGLILVVYFYLLFEFAAGEQIMSFAVAFFKCAWLPIIFFIPLVTMRIFSEEYKNGILKNTLTTKATVNDIVTAKVLATFVFFVSILAFIWLIFQITKYSLPSFVNDMSFAGTFEISGGILFLMTLGFFYISIGMLCSSLTENQVIAGMLTFGTLFGLLLLGQYGVANSININFKNTLSMTDFISPFLHIENFCSGLIDSRPIIFYMSAAICVLCTTKHIVKNKVR